MILDLTLILQSLAIGLGVGSSTLAIINFFVAIWDGKIDPNERKMMGIVYIVLRVAMVVILLASTTTTLLMYITDKPFETYHAVEWTLLFILFTNSILMTKHLLPSAFGPAIQSSAWYSLGIFATIYLIGWNFTYIQFSIFYLTLFFIAVSVINLTMIYSKNLQKESAKRAS